MRKELQFPEGKFLENTPQQVQLMRYLPYPTPSAEILAPSFAFTAIFKIQVEETNPSRFSFINMNCHPKVIEIKKQRKSIYVCFVYRTNTGTNSEGKK